MSSYPPGWEKRSLKEIGKIITGTTPSTKKQEYYGGDYKLISPANLDNGKYISTWHKRLSKAGFEKAKPLPKNAILVGCIGNVGKIGMTADDMSATNQQINSIVCKTNYDPHYIYYCLVFNRPRLEKVAVKTTVPILNKSSFEKFVILVPPFPEQRKIAALLSLVQKAIEQQEQLIALTTELKKALMHKLFTEGTRGEPQKMTEIGPVPESWEVTTIGKICRLQSGGTPSRKVAKYWNGTIPWVKTGEVDNCFITKTEEYITQAGIENSSAKIFPKGTLLIAMYGQGITRGKVAILDIEAATNQACAAITPLNPDQLTTKFLFYFLQFQYRQLRDWGHGANQKNLSMMLIKMFPIAYPKIDEQNEIVNVLLKLDRKITLCKRKHIIYKSLFRSLLHQLMTAQIRVGDIELKILREENV